MELMVGLVMGALLGYLAGNPRADQRQKDEISEHTPSRQEAEPLEEQWQRICNYEGYPSVREDEDA